jgi:hypothetical protein
MDIEMSNDLQNQDDEEEKDQDAQNSECYKEKALQLLEIYRKEMRVDNSFNPLLQPN